MSRLDKVHEARIKSHTCLHIREILLPPNSISLCLVAGTRYCHHCCLGSRKGQRIIIQLREALDE